jgi:hypothetical protein
MSDIRRLKEQLHDIQRRTNTTGGHLQGFIKDFEKKSTEVQGLIAGTASGADKDIIQILDAASKSVTAAIGALKMAGDACRKASNSL